MLDVFNVNYCSLTILITKNTYKYYQCLKVVIDIMYFFILMAMPFSAAPAERTISQSRRRRSPSRESIKVSMQHARENTGKVVTVRGLNSLGII